MDNDNNKIKSSVHSDTNVQNTDAVVQPALSDANKKCRDLDEYIFRFNLEKTVSER